MSFTKSPASCAALTSAMLLAMVLIGLVPAPGRSAAAQANPCLVTTANGAVQGLLRGGVCTYLGIPYATPPVGNLRWRPPQPRAPWAPATINATAPAANCPGLNQATGAPQGDENCLTLNIWAPAARPVGRGAPVLVWLHTGGFIAASSNFPSHDGQRFAAEQNAIVVAPNYRLGPFGFLAQRALTDEDPAYPSSGNYGLADQRAALGWVREHVVAFGGDPTRVTVAGTSAGGMSASLQLVSPATRGLFHRAILQSQYATSRLVTLDEAHSSGDAFAAALGCTDRASTIACLRGATRDQVLRALPVGQYQIVEDPGRMIWGPVVDGFEIPDQPRELYRRGQFSRVPVIIGVTGDEGWTFVDRSFPAGLDESRYAQTVRNEFGIDANAVLAIYPAQRFSTPKDALARLTGDVEFVCEARRVARALQHDGAPVYVYSFEHPLEGATAGRAIHGLESNFVFANPFAANAVPGVPSARAFTADDLVVSNAMNGFWGRFVATGDPNPPGAPAQWPPFMSLGFGYPVDGSTADRYFVFASRLGVASYLRDPQCNFWEPFFFRSALGAVPAAAR